MESLPPVTVKHIAAFLEFKDMVSFSQTRQPFQADLKPLIRKAEVAMMKENGKLKKVVTFMARAMSHIDIVARADDAEECMAVVDVIFNMLERKFGDFWELSTRPLHETYAQAYAISRHRRPPPLAYFEGPAEDDEAIVQHFLNQMD